MMNGCPLICFPNNEELQGDAEKVLSLIDGYDRTLSDMNSEIEQFRLAYMAFYGSVPDDTTLKLARQTGAFGFPEKDMRMEFITKNINDAAVQNHLSQLDRNIMYFAQTVRFSDESFGTASGVALKFKLFALEQKVLTAERKFTKSLYRMMKALLGYYERKGIEYDPMEFEFVFTRNFPQQTLEEMQVIATGKGLISDDTLYSQISFIKDPQQEIQKMKDEQEEYAKYSAMLNPQPEVPTEETAPEEELPEEAEPGVPQETQSSEQVPQE